MKIILSFTGNYSLVKSISLAAKAAFIEGFSNPQIAEIYLAFPLEGSWKSVSVKVKEEPNQLTMTVLDNPENATIEAIEAQIKRILCLDVDGTAFTEVGKKDVVIEKLQEQQRGLRPVLFNSPYEAAARAIITHQLPLKVAANITNRIAKDFGTKLKTEQGEIYAFPTPNQLIELPFINGLAQRKVEQLRKLGKVADESWFRTEHLKSLNREEAMEKLQSIAGISPFSAELIMVRGVGDADYFPLTEKRLHNAMISTYNLEKEPEIKVLQAIAEQWQPFRSWAGLLLRNA